MSSDDRTVYLGPPAGDADDRTLLIPRPGGRAMAGAAADASRTAASTPKAGGTETLQRLVAGLNPLIVAANELLALLPQLRATTVHHDRAGLRRQLLERVADFEERARASGVGKPQLAAARYLLCTFVDETIAATPWGALPQPGVDGLLQAFHEDASGGDKCFELLDRLSADARANRDLLELFYVCLALGFEGRHAGARDAQPQLQQRLDRLFELVRPEPATPAGTPRVLSQRWAGATSHRPPALTTVPIWMALAVAGALVTGGAAWFASRVQRDAGTLMQQLHELRRQLGADRGDAAAPRVAPTAARLAPLQADAALASWLDEVRDEPQRSRLSLPADRLFVGATAQLDERARAPLQRIARSLAAAPGRVEVLAHGDDRFTPTLRHPSSWQLTRERAAAVLTELQRHGVAAERSRADGRADVEPRAANDSEAARARNRRVEIVLLLPRPE